MKQTKMMDKNYKELRELVYSMSSKELLRYIVFNSLITQQSELINSGLKLKEKEIFNFQKEVLQKIIKDSKKK